MAQTEPESESQPKEKVVPVAVTDSDEPSEDQPSGLPAVIGMENITLSGTDLDFEIVGDKLILKGNPKDLDIIEALITVLEESRETKEIRLETLEQRDANEVARTIESALREAFFEPNQRPEDQISIIALSSTLLLVSALPNQIDVVIDVIRKADEADETLGKIEQLIFQIKHRKATEVADELREIIGKLRSSKGDQGAEDKFQIIPNVANNTITVMAPESEREKIQRLIDAIDVEPVKGWGTAKLTFYPLLHSKANELADTINELLATSQDREAAEETIYRLLISKAMPSGEVVELPPIDLQKPTKVFPDEGTNSLIVRTVEENIEPMGELIRLLDDVAIAEGLDIRLFPLRFADAETIRDLLKEMFDGAETLSEDPDGSGQGAVPEGDTGKALVYNVNVQADVRTNTLIVTGRPEQLALAKRLVGDLDRPATALKFPLRLIPMEHTDATRIGEIIEDLFQQRFEAVEATGAGRAVVERERIYLVVDIRTNSLIFSGSEENYDEVITIVTQLDTKPAKLFDQIRIIRCQRLDAADLKQKIEDLWQRKADLRREADLLEDLPVVVADERSNSLIIASSMDDFEEIKRLVETLEAQPLIDDTRLFKLHHTDAVVLTEMLDELFQGMASDSESFTAPTILPDSRTNSLVVAATRDTMERVEELIARLDVEAGPTTAMFKVYPLENGSAIQLAPKMQELFDSRSEGQEGARTPIVIIADETSNSLITSASRDDHDVLNNLLAMLDKPSDIAKHFEIFALRMAKAATVAEKLEALFASQAEGGQGRVDAIATEADERTNSLIVWASPAQMANIAEVIARLDTSAPAVEMEMKVIQLKQALAEDFAQLLEETLIGDAGEGDDARAIIITMEEEDEFGRTVTRKFLRQDIKIQPDRRTNSLMVMAPAESMDMLEKMIRDFDRIRPIRSEIRLFHLVNSDAEAMVDQLEEIFRVEGGGDEGEATTQLMFGSEFDDLDFARVGQELRLTADSRTNTLIAAGAEVDLRMVEQLVYTLDAQEAEERVTEVYHAKFRDAQEIASAMENFYQQELSVLGEGDDEESRMLRMDRQVTVEAVGDEESGSSSLLIGTSTNQYRRTMDLIEQLDRPEPQVMIQVLIMEVLLNDSIELGVEIAGQQLDFSDSAVLGPNGVIQGSDFDFVLGTDLGAAGLGLGGINFTMTGEDFSFLFHAVQQDSKTEVLSRPILLVRNGDEGSITIADQIPIVESTRLNDTGQTQSTIGREDVGIILTVTPHISPDGYVTIDMVQEISQIAGENVQLTEGVSSPVFQTRTVETNVTMRDGETVVIGGLIQTRRSESENKVPILGDLPLIGWLFRFTSVSETRAELLIVMTVDIVRNDADLRAVSKDQADRYELTPWIRKNRLMKGLRILPEEGGMGPVDETKSPTPIQKHPHPEPRDQFGPKPKIYGPAIRRSQTETTKRRPVYGPRIARSDG